MVCVLSFLHPVSPLSVIPKPFSFLFSCTVIHVMILLRNRFQVAQMRMLIDAVRYFLKQMEIQCLAYLQEKLLGKNSVRRTIWHSLLTTNLLQGRRTLRLPIYQREDTDTTYITEWPSTTTTDLPILFQKQKSKICLLIYSKFCLMFKTVFFSPGILTLCIHWIPRHSFCLRSHLQKKGWRGDEINPCPDHLSLGKMPWDNCIS